MRRYEPSARGAGFTIVETLVALTLFQIGMWALLATAGVLARDLAEATWRRRAEAVARNRVELLRAQACRGTAAGARTLPGGVEERWRLDGDGPTRTLWSRAEVALPRGRRLVVESTGMALCPR